MWTLHEDQVIVLALSSVLIFNSQQQTNYNFSIFSVHNIIISTDLDLVKSGAVATWDSYTVGR